MRSTSRRKFISAVATLPVIGAGAAMASTAATESCSDAALRTYVAFLAQEYRTALCQFANREGKTWVETCRIVEDGLKFVGVPDSDPVGDLIFHADADSRAVAVLQAVGLPTA